MIARATKCDKCRRTIDLDKYNVVEMRIYPQGADFHAKHLCASCVVRLKEWFDFR